MPSELSDVFLYDLLRFSDWDIDFSWPFCICYIEFNMCYYLMILLLASLNKALKDYETLHHDTFRHRVTKRAIHTGEAEERHLEFDTLGRSVDFLCYFESKIEY